MYKLWKVCKKIKYIRLTRKKGGGEGVTLGNSKK